MKPYEIALSTLIVIAILLGVSHSVSYLTQMYDNIQSGVSLTTELREYSLLLVLDVYLVAAVLFWIINKLEVHCGKTSN